MDSVDLEITPVERAVRIVVVYFAVASRVLGPLYGECDSTGGTEFITSVLLERRQPAAKLIGLGRFSLLFHDSGCNNDWELPTQSERWTQ
jgi:hypothetical protein